VYNTRGPYQRSRAVINDALEDRMLFQQSWANIAPTKLTGCRPHNEIVTTE
jgi:hypothetical protein